MSYPIMFLEADRKLARFCVCPCCQLTVLTRFFASTSSATTGYLQVRSVYLKVVIGWIIKNFMLGRASAVQTA